MRKFWKLGLGQEYDMKYKIDPLWYYNTNYQAISPVSLLFSSYSVQKRGNTLFVYITKARASSRNNCWPANNKHVMYDGL